MIMILNKPILGSSLILWIVLILGCSPNLEDQVKTYEQVHNRHDIEKVMSLYTKDITFEIVGTWTKVGIEQVRKLAEWDAATNSHMIISDIEIHRDTVTFKLKEGNDWWRLAGIEDLYYEPCRMVFQGGKINQLKAEVTQESMKAFQEVWPAIVQWASKERSEALSELMPEGEFVYSAESAKRWLALLREWRENTNQP